MRKLLPYIVALAVLVILGSVIIASSKRAPRKMDNRITLRQKDKIPYGTAVARSLIPVLFPQAFVSTDNYSPSNWETVNSASDQAMILVAREFNADDDELGRLLYFARQGNQVFIICKTFSDDAATFFNFTYNRFGYENYFDVSEDSLLLRLEKPFFPSDQPYVYPGKKYETSFNRVDSVHSQVLGRNEEGRPNFVRYRAGKGNIFIHTAPMAFSNYFILHKNNSEYFRQVCSVIPATVRHIVWNEYYLTKPSGQSREKKPNWLGALLQHPSFTWGLITGALFLLLMVVLGMRRRQRMIPVYRKPKNESLDFVRTLGRLYHDRSDHQNLARKMGVYFLEHVRAQYKLPTHVLDEEFVRSLHYKSGYPVEELNRIVYFTGQLENPEPITEKQLAEFYQQLELFYQNT